MELESEELRFDSLSVREAAIAPLAFGNATLSRRTFTPAVLKAPVRELLRSVAGHNRVGKYS